MKNYLLFIIDSLNYSHVKASPVELMPFMKSLEAKGVYCENMFSQAPYTEAAVMSIYCGQDVLQNGGYLHRFKDAPLTIFEAMQEKGYVTYFNSYQPQCHPSSVRRGVDHLYYNVGFDQEALWPYRFSHYAEVFRKGEMQEKDYAALHEIMEDNFEQWLLFTEDVLSDDKSVDLIRNNAPDYDAALVQRMVREQQNAYRQDPKGYLKQLFEQGNEHALFKIPVFAQKAKIADREVVQQIKEDFTPLFKRIQRMNLRLNLKNGKGILRGPVRKFGEMLKRPSVASAKNLAKSMLLSANSLVDTDLFQRLDNCDQFKNAPSGRSHVDHYISWAKEQPKEKPYFACIHIDDVHNPEVFFTYDSSDRELLKQEAKIAEELLDKIPGSYSGSLSHDLSLRYIDSVVEYLFKQMENNQLLEDTCVLICADHGFSFSGNPLRDSFVVNLYLENYNIPFVIVNSGLEAKSYSKLCASKDIPATLCYLADGAVPEAFTGHSITEEHDYPCVQIEYCGGGCPDIMRRELKIAAFDHKYFVGTLGTLEAPVCVTEVYDLEKDPLQLCNLVKNGYDKTAVQPLLLHITNRKKEMLASVPAHFLH